MWQVLKMQTYNATMNLIRAKGKTAAMNQQQNAAIAATCRKEAAAPAARAASIEEPVG